MKFLFKSNKHSTRTPNLHETFMDRAAIEAGISVQEGEGRLRSSIDLSQVVFLWLLALIMVLGILSRVGFLQVVQGSEYAFVSENNTFAEVTVSPIRGDILDRNGEKLAWNDGSDGTSVPIRQYIGEGFSTLLGFIRYPKEDSQGILYRVKTEGEGGIEAIYNGELAGEVGSLVLERDAHGEVVSNLFKDIPSDGETITLTIDAELQQLLFTTIKEVVKDYGSVAGAAVLLDIWNGEILSLVSYPEFDNAILTNKPNDIQSIYLQQQDEGVFVHRAISGLYSPGSTIKPFFAVAALEENIVSPSDIISSTGSITVQNPYDPEILYIYKDWKAHGPLTISDAIAWSSNVFFYHIGGGYENTYEGLGIDRLKVYANLFGFGVPTNLTVFHEPKGLIPNPVWKEERYAEEWRIGDTYNTVIGQYAFQVTPLQLTRAIAAIANNGIVVEPRLLLDEIPKMTKLFVSEHHLETVRAGMRKTVIEGTAKILNQEGYSLAVKTGTAQTGRENKTANSLLIGFFPYDAPRYAFSIVIERGEEGAAIAVAKRFFDTLVNSKVGQPIILQ